MLHWFHTELKTVARGTLALAGLMWLVVATAPCVMAQTANEEPASSHCPKPAKHKNPGPAALTDCGLTTAINCQLPDSDTPLTTGFGDFSITPVLLVTLPVPVLLSDNGQPPRPDFFAPDIHAPPLHIRYLTLTL